MKRGKWRFRLHSLLFAGALLSAGAGAAVADDDLMPYKVLRSLQFVQDSVVQGDHSAAEMQRFILETIDKRLRASSPEVFEDPRNVDAALIYAMSGGNPDTLEYLVARDVDGNFDGRVVDALRKYFSGQGTLIAKGLADMTPEYRDTRIGPYLALVSGNIVLSSDVNAALGFFDQARLAAPGTIVEEAALRRSLAIAIESNMVERSLGFANRYARRFLHSPYASQFADLFVQLVVSHYGAVSQEAMDDTLALMDGARAREVYLRIARRAALAGKGDLARIAAAAAEKLAGETADGREALGSLYGNVAAIPSAGIGEAVKAIANIPDDQLSERDRALRDAAKVVAEEIMRTPVASSSTQASTGNVVSEQMRQAQESGQDDPQAPAVKDGETPATPGESAGQDVDGEHRSFVEKGRSQLDAIDALLKQEGMSR